MIGASAKATAPGTSTVTYTQTALERIASRPTESPGSVAKAAKATTMPTVRTATVSASAAR